MVRTYLDHLAVERGLAGNTLLSYRRDLARYVAHLAARGVDSLDAVTEELISDFLLSLRSGDGDHRPLSAGSAARAVVAVRGLHRFAMREGLARTDPSRSVRPPAPGRRLPKAMPLEQVEALLAAARAGESPLTLRNASLLELLYGTGARISEAVSLDLDDVALEGGSSSSVRLFGKGGRERVVPVGSYARAALSAYLVRARPALAASGRGTPAVFLNARG
ncbi:MAG: site-specific integrase, partial [Streptomycetales bacterium]